MGLGRSVEAVKFDAKKHWLLLQLWWSERKFTPPPLEFMPPTGFVVLMNEHPVCAGFLTMTDANVCVLGHLVSDPRVAGEYRHGAMDYLMNCLIAKAKASDMKMVFASTNLSGLQERYQKHGFQLTDEKINVYGRSLCRGG